MPGGKTARNVSKDSRRRSATTGRRRRFYARKLWRRRKWPEGWRNRRTGLSVLPQDGPRPRARVPTLEQMNDQLRNDQPNKNESGPGPTSRTPTVAASSSTNDHLEEVVKGQAQQAEFLQHMWVQQSQMQQALQQHVCALRGAIQQLAETQQAAAAWTSEETRRKTSRG